MVAFFGKIDFYENSRAFRRGWRDGSLWDTTVMRLSFFFDIRIPRFKDWWNEHDMDIWKVLETRHFFLFHFLSTIPSKPAHLRSFLWCFFWFCDQVAHDPFMLIWMQSWEVCRKTYIYIYIYIYINYISYRFIWLTQQVCVGPKWTEPTGPKMGYSIEWD